MSATAKGEAKGLTSYFSMSQARVDRWRSVHRLARKLAAGSPLADSLRAQAAAELDALAPIEDLSAYPGPRLLATVRERLQTGDASGFARLVQRISVSLLSNSYRDDVEAWKAEDEGESHAPEVAPPGLGGAAARKPYFEVLVVTPGERSTWNETREALRRLRRDTDSFVYEPVVVGSFEDAALAAIFNYNIQAVVVFDGFAYPSQYTVPDLREILAAHVPAETTSEADLGTTLARMLKAYRPELDIYLATDRNVGKLAGSDEAACIRRVFYGLEELLEIHLSILDGVNDRYATPYFDNLKKYAQRPMGTFHALPIARGKSIFKSNWIRDMGEFYGANLFLAESSATTGGLDSLLEPTGNIKTAQDKAARALGGDRTFLVTNGTSTSNKIVHMALLNPGDIVLIDRDCHKSHHYGLVLAGAQPYYIEGFPLTQYSMFGSLAIKPIKEALLTL
jgi:arginine decarboxylase